MSDAFVDWYDQLVSVETVATSDEWGATTSTPHTDVPCFVESSAVQVVTAGGTEVQATTILYAGIAHLSKFTPGSVVTLPDGRVASVLTVDSADSDPDLAGVTVHLG